MDLDTRSQRTCARCSYQYTAPDPSDPPCTSRENRPFPTHQNLAIERAAPTRQSCCMRTDSAAPARRRTPRSHQILRRSARLLLTAALLALLGQMLPPLQPEPAASLPGTGPRNAWAWPLAPQPEVRRGFDPPERAWLPGHRGVDLTAAQGQPVLAPASGTVSFSGWLVDRYVLTIDHGSLRSSFEPAFSSLAVGEPVQRGQTIGTVRAGSANRSEQVDQPQQPGPGPPVSTEQSPAAPAAPGNPAKQTMHCSVAGADCLHWGVRSGQSYLNPLAFLSDRRPSVLLPFEVAAIRGTASGLG